jgi:hypothetical protein
MRKNAPRGIGRRPQPSALPCALAALLLAALAGCASTAENEPVLYPNRHLQQVGRAAAEQDIRECRHLAHTHRVRETRDGEVARKTAGDAAGAAKGTMESGETSPVFRNFVQRCLRERGYEVIGWQ